MTNPNHPDPIRAVILRVEGASPADALSALVNLEEQLEASQKALLYWVDRADHFEERLPEEKQYVRARGVLTPEYKLGRSLSNPAKRPT